MKQNESKTFEFVIFVKQNIIPGSSQEKIVMFIP